MPEYSPNLDRLERWMLEVVSHPNGVEAGLQTDSARSQLSVSPEQLEQVVEPSASLTSIERMQIYANTYLWRLAEVLGEEFAGVRHVLGSAEFMRLTREYVRENPPNHYSLNQLGARFPAFIRARREALLHGEFLADLAKLERTLDRVFDAQEQPRLTPEQFAEVPMDAWGDMRLRTIDAMALVESSYPTNDYLQAVREQRHMDLPQRATTWTLIYRRSYTCYRYDHSLEEHVLLQALQQGQSLALALAHAASHSGVDTERLMTHLQEWFRDWTAMGLFCALDSENDPDMPAAHVELD